MEILANPYLISLLLALAVGLLLYSFFMARNEDTYLPTLTEEAQKSKGLRLLTSFSSNLYDSLPAGITYKAKDEKANARLNDLLQRSGNPWGVTADEFRFLQVGSAVLGFIIGWPLWLLLHSVNAAFPWFVIVAITTIFGFFYPRMKHTSLAKERDFAFKRQMPEALDLIVISLSGGTHFMEALRQAIPNMEEGVLKDEFKEVLRNVDAGRTMNEALERFGKRVPSDSIQTFVQALREANELNTPMVEVLEARSKESREEFFALLHEKTASLSSKMGGVLAPTLIGALLLILAAPSFSSLITSLA